MSTHWRGLLYFAAGAVSAGSLCMVCSKLWSGWAQVYTSPVQLYSNKPASSLRRLPYPPIDFIPGARDVPTPYGTIRLYEWGPTTGRRVLLLHGISGSCVVLLTLAEQLAKDGCRVMLLDLFGRGWSGGPADVPYDGRLYASQIFMSLASSEISWTGGDRGAFAIIGYSLGGGIAADFASYFPDLVEDLVLIAPGGLMTSDWRSRFYYSGLLPEAYMRRFLRSRLLGSSTAPVERDLPDGDEAAGQTTDESSAPDLAKGLDADAIVAWQLDHNPGFVKAFQSSIRFAPTKYQHDRWRLIGEHVRARQHRNKSQNFSSGNVLLILGGQDSIIGPAEIVPEATAVLGRENLEVKVYEDAGHGVGMSKGLEIAEFLRKRWAT